ncbi:hypothetical protein MRX96_041359 [Rhipicephalus microplus]
MVSMAASQKRAAKRPRSCHTLSAKGKQGPRSAQRMHKYVLKGLQPNKDYGLILQDGAQNNVFRLAADQDQKASSSEDGCEKNMKRQSNFTDHSVSEAGQMTDGEASHDTCKSESSSDSELDNNQEPVKGAPEDSGSATDGRAATTANQSRTWSQPFADLIFDIIFEVLWHFIESFIPPQHA